MKMVRQSVIAAALAVPSDHPPYSNRKATPPVFRLRQLGIALRQFDGELDRLTDQCPNDPRTNSHLLALVATSMCRPSVRMLIVPTSSVRSTSLPTRRKA